MLGRRMQRIRSLEAELIALRGHEAALLARVHRLERQLHDAEEALRYLSAADEAEGRLPGLRDRLREDLGRFGTPLSAIRQTSPRG